MPCFLAPAAWDTVVETLRAALCVVSGGRARGVDRALSGALVLRSREHRVFFLGLTTLFVVCNLVMFQPWHLDNTKLFYVWVFGASGYVALVLDHWLRATFDEGGALVRAAPAGPLRWGVRGVGLLGGVAAFIALTFSGAFATWREMLNYAKLYDDIDFDLADWIVENTPPNATFLHDISQSNHIRVESSLAGRQVAHGFNGWLHSHGINSNERRYQLMAVLNGDENGVRGLQENKIDYITVDAAGKNNFNYAFLDDVSNLVATNGKYSIYKVLPHVRSKKWASKPCSVGGKPVGLEKNDCLAAGCWFWDNAPQERRCMEKPRKRKVEDCLVGKGASPEICRSEGCVWVQGYPGPWCQKPGWGKPEKIQMRRPGQPGSDCGWHNMNTQDCVDKGCVWSTPDDPCVLPPPPTPPPPFPTRAPSRTPLRAHLHDAPPFHPARPPNTPNNAGTSPTAPSPRPGRRPASTIRRASGSTDKGGVGLEGAIR